jgi:predicted acylesterase/phospholipase RssA
MYDDVYVEGHGASTAMSLGAMDALGRAGLLAPRRRTTCFSMASVMAVAMALGKRPLWLLSLARDSGLLRLSPATLVLCAAFRSVRVWLTRRLCRLLSACGVPRGLTMRELHERTGHDVRVLVASLSRGRTHVVHAGNAPGAVVRHVLLASCCVPGVFEFDGDLVDGATFGGFRDAALAAPRGALVLATDVGRSAGPTVVVAYRTLLHKLKRAWTDEARRAGAAVLVMREPGAAPRLPMHAGSLDAQFLHGAMCTMRLISSCDSALERGLLSARVSAAAAAATKSAGSGGAEHSRSILAAVPSRAASASIASMSASRRTGV